MAIITRNAPRGAATVLAANVTDMLRAKHIPPGMKADVHPEELEHSEPHPVYVATLDDLAGGKLLSAARQTGWRYLLVQHDEVVAEAELSAARPAAKGAKGAKKSAGAKQELTFASLTHGPFSGATVDGLHAAERLPQVEKNDYELRLLKVPAVYLVALWLHGAHEDILVPLGQPPAGLKKNKAYTEASVIRALRATAARTKEFNDAYGANQRKRLPKKR